MSPHLIPDFRRLQYECDAVISGSSALGFFTEKRYQNVDLDIYVPEARSPAFLEFMHDNFELALDTDTAPVPSPAALSGPPPSHILAQGESDFMVLPQPRYIDGSIASVTNFSFNGHIPLPEVYTRRAVDGGVYDDVTFHAVQDANIRTYLGTSANSLNVSYEIFKGAPKPNDGWDSYEVVKKDGRQTPFKCMVVGEMRGKANGTRMGPLGNFYVGSSESPRPMNDGTKCRNVLMLGEPTNATTALSGLWQNQISELHALKDQLSALTSNNDIGPIVKPGSNGEENIKVVTDLIYTDAKFTPKSATGTNSKVQITKDSIAAVNKGEPSKTITQSTNNETEAQPEIKLNALYPVSCFPNRVGSMFQQNHSSVKQLPIFDINGYPVAPWLMHEVLRPGVLLLVEGVFNIWCPPKKSPILQFEACRIKVTAESLESIEYPIVPAGPSTKKQADFEDDSTGNKRAAPFDSFGPVTKKSRAEEADDIDMLVDPAAIEWAPSPPSTLNQITHIDNAPTQSKPGTNSNKSKAITPQSTHGDNTTAPQGTKNGKAPQRNKGKARADD
ncbi:hypothetical protein CVT24_006488 [Panaeolus cyanescens]|uniref:Uncharacterized protein n=1 Tax=Panaeolus cyanescens TaxID=181874 RepID=A0A409WSU1_9AGAR|nr:hypothetical protein CVT24_006488 [Panaeolus cyanescens]